MRNPSLWLCVALPLLLQADRVRGVDPVSAPAPSKPALYTRVGGVYGIAEIADAWVVRLWKDRVLLSNPALRAARDRLTPAAVKFHLAIVLCEAAGGPCRFEGVGGAPAGTDLKIDPAQWAAIRADLVEVLGKRKLAQPERAELLALLDGHIAAASRTLDDFAFG